MPDDKTRSKPPAAVDPFDLNAIPYRGGPPAGQAPVTPMVISTDPEDAPTDAKELRLLSEGKQRYSKGFPQWFPSNWHIWRAFCQQADIMWRKNRDHYSARTIIEYLRHNSALADVEENFKINNNYAPDLARLYMAVHSDRGNFFELRQMPTSVRED